jgi:IS5 family transposase
VNFLDILCTIPSGSVKGICKTPWTPHYISYKCLINKGSTSEKLSVTAANLHDSQMDLSIPEIICYRDKGYFGSECSGFNETMDRSVRGHKLPLKSIRRNLKISRIRSMVEHPYTFFKGMFHFFQVMSTVKRVRAKTYFTAMC